MEKGRRENRGLAENSAASGTARMQPFVSTTERRRPVPTACSLACGSVPSPLTL